VPPRCIFHNAGIQCPRNDTEPLACWLTPKAARLFGGEKQTVNVCEAHRHDVIERTRELGAKYHNPAGENWYALLSELGRRSPDE
jgi:hypothetical protein